MFCMPHAHINPDACLVSVTRLRVRSWRFLPGFLYFAFRSSRQATHAPGVLSVRVLADRHRTYWTVTVWQHQTAMKAFMISGAHAAAMKRLLFWCDEASVAHWMQDDSAPPEWAEAHRRMQSEGRRSKVLKPSAAHTAFTIAEPVIGPSRDVRFK